MNLRYLSYVNAGGHPSLLKLRHHQFLRSVVKISFLSESMVNTNRPDKKQCQEKNQENP